MDGVSGPKSKSLTGERLNPHRTIFCVEKKAGLTIQCAVPAVAQQCLRQLDLVASNVEDATLLAVNGEKKDACHVLVARVKPAIERWLGLLSAFAEQLEIDRLRVPNFGDTPNQAQGTGKGAGATHQ